MKELVRFDPEAPAGQRLRAWDRVREDLVERQIEGDRTPCLTLGLNWTVGAAWSFTSPSTSTTTSTFAREPLAPADRRH